MKKISETILFFGSGPVAAKSLELLAKDFSIEAVVTKPKPEHHRGDFPVLEVAKKLALKLYTPENKHQLSELFTTQPAKSQIGVVIDYGIIITKDVIDYFPLGIVNSHFSLLPQWRGADPITFSILSGQDKTGVSLMLIDEQLDTGKLIAQRSLPITRDTTTPKLTEELINLSVQMLAEYLPQYIKGELVPRAQPHPDRATYSRKLTKDDGIIDWNKPAEQIEREIRAFKGWPGSRATLAGKDIIVTKAHLIPVNHEASKPGDLEVVDGLLMVECGDGTLCIDRLKPAGKREMSTKEFLAGNRLH